MLQHFSQFPCICRNRRAQISLFADSTVFIHMKNVFVASFSVFFSEQENLNNFRKFPFFIADYFASNENEYHKHRTAGIENQPS